MIRLSEHYALTDDTKPDDEKKESPRILTHTQSGRRIIVFSSPPTLEEATIVAKRIEALRTISHESTDPGTWASTATPSDLKKVSSLIAHYGRDSWLSDVY